MKTILQDATWYGIASLCALLVDVGLLWILVKFLSVNYLLAATISFLCGATVAYVISIRWVFRYRRLRDRRAEFVGFVALGLPGLALNAGVISVAVRHFGLHYLWAKGAAALTTFSWNFVVRRQILFQRK
jgi:putative flippase GtrA